MEMRLWMSSTETIGSIDALSGRTEGAYRWPCRILGAYITRVARGGEESVICDEYCEADGGCQLRKAALELGALQGLTDALSEGVARARTRCIMLTT